MPREPRNDSPGPGLSRSGASPRAFANASAVVQEGSGLGCRKSDRLAHGAYTRGCSLGANRNATRINRLARAARCAGVTCTRHLEGCRNRTLSPDRLATPQPTRCVARSCRSRGGRSGRRTAGRHHWVMAAHDAKSLWGTLTPHQKARRGPWPRGRMVARGRIGSVVNFELRARGDLGHRLLRRRCVGRLLKGFLWRSMRTGWQLPA